MSFMSDPEFDADIDAETESLSLIEWCAGPA